MKLQVIEEKELNQQPSADCHKVEQGSLPKKPRLSMKFLYELIRELQHENFTLVQRIDELERQFAGFHRFEEEAAAAVEVPEVKEPEKSHEGAQGAQGAGEPEKEIRETKDVQELYKVSDLQEESLKAVLAEVLEPQTQPQPLPQQHPEPNTQQPIRTPRSERHQSPKRNSFWPFRLHHRTILR